MIHGRAQTSSRANPVVVVVIRRVVAAIISHRAAAAVASAGAHVPAEASDGTLSGPNAPK